MPHLEHSRTDLDVLNPGIVPPDDAAFEDTQDNGDDRVLQHGLRLAKRLKTRQAKGGSGGAHDLQPTLEPVEAAVEATDNHYTTWKYSSDMRMVKTAPL